MSDFERHMAERKRSATNFAISESYELWLIKIFTIIVIPMLKSEFVFVLDT